MNHENTKVQKREKERDSHETLFFVISLFRALVITNLLFEIRLPIDTELTELASIFLPTA
jgi:hypothetical protein